ncbi:glycosyltransferase family 2 protein [Pedobacter sp. MW01-1-1]|uniref:glycosyltransferase family 2 protein n=1 Tax=Pedobacter sp. MW01-1-1 TaxID=3383027 RepID=UPI003FF00EE3
MKITLITVVFNGEKYLEDCILSVLNQTYKNLEYIIVDGGSTDDTLKIIGKYKDQIQMVISEKDKGLYDALNKGISMATGEVVGMLHADDLFADMDVVAEVVRVFENHETDAVYGDLNYIHPLTLKVIRKWTSKQANSNDIKNGWMPAHPTLYLKRCLFEKYGYYALDMGTAADYDLMVRYFFAFKIVAQYLPKLLVNMRTGGLSNQSISNRAKALMNDYKALKRNQVPYPWRAVLKKKLSKLTQYAKI